MKRREFLQVASAAALACSVPTGLHAARPSVDPRLQILANPDLLRLLDDPESIRDIGRTYRAAWPEEDSAHRLVETLRSGLPSDAPVADVRSLIAQKIRRDFQSGDMVQVKGWMLSRTEARQSALFSVLDPQIRPQ